MVVLVTGATGQLGQALQYIAPHYPEITFHFSGSEEIDITDSLGVANVFNTVKPKYCINAAAYTAVDKAENEAEKAHSINVDGVKNLAEICKKFGATLLHVSTDFVFDGYQKAPYTETDIPNPQGIYGATKLEGEIAIAQTMKAYFIIRTSWLYSQFGTNFMKTMLRLGKEKTALNVVDDQIGTPTHAIDLAAMLLTIIKSNSQQYGIYHYSNEGSISWFDFAKKIFEINKIDIALHPIPTTQYPTPALRPKYSVLDKSKIKKTFDVLISNWDEALEKYSDK